MTGPVDPMFVGELAKVSREFGCCAAEAAGTGVPIAQATTTAMSAVVIRRR